MNIRLFELIKSLTPEEKRHFKLSAKYGTAKNYIKLFNIIDAQELYDEKAIRKKYASENWIKNLSATKNYLYELILRNLEHNPTQIIKTSGLLSGLAQISILFNKTLFEQANTLIEKYIKVAKEHNGVHFLPILYLWRLQLTLNSSDIANKKISWFDQKTRDYIAASKELLYTAQTYRYQTYISYIQTQTPPLTKANRLKKVEKIFLKLQKNIPFTFAINHVMRLYAALSAAFILRNKTYTDATLDKLLHFFDAEPNIKQSQTTVLAGVLINASYFYLSIRDFEKTSQLFAKIHNFEIPKDRESLFLTSILESSQIWLLLYESTQKMGQTTTDSQVDEALLYIQNNKQITERAALLIQYFAGCVCLLNRQYEKALLCWDCFWGHFLPKFRYFQAHALLLRGFVLYKNESYELIPHAVSVSTRFLKKINAYNGFGRILLQFLGELGKNSFAVPNWANLNEKLSACYEHNKLSPNQFFPYLDWVEQQIQKN